jgi:hypothetical protein
MLFRPLCRIIRAGSDTQRWSCHSIRCRSSAVNFFAGTSSTAVGLSASFVPPPNARWGFSSSHRRRALSGVSSLAPLPGPGSLLAPLAGAVAGTLAVCCPAGSAAGVPLGARSLLPPAGREGVELREAPCCAASRARVDCCLGAGLSLMTALAAACGSPAGFSARVGTAARMLPADLGRSGRLLGTAGWATTVAAAALVLGLQRNGSMPYRQSLLHQRHL